MSIVDMPLKHPQVPGIGNMLSALHPRFKTLSDMRITWTNGFVDRSGVLALPCVECITPIPDLTAPFSKSIEQVVLETAQSLVDTGMPLRVFWSGGIDSTLIVAALREVGAPPSQVTIVCNENSAYEYPDGLRVIADTYEVELRYRCIVYGADRTGSAIGVTGEFGDFLFLPILESVYREVWQHPNNVGAVLLPWQDIFTSRTLYERDNKLPRLTTEQFDLLSMFAAAAPFALGSYLQFWFWWQYCTKWQWVRLRSSVGWTPEEFAGYSQRHFAFYGTDDMQRWAIANAAAGWEVLPEWKQVKQPLKDLLQQWMPDDVYYQNKMAEGSMVLVGYNTGRYVAKRHDGYEIQSARELLKELQK